MARSGRKRSPIPRSSLKNVPESQNVSERPNECRARETKSRFRLEADHGQMMNRVAERDGREILFGQFGPIHLETKYEITNYVVDGSRHSADVVTKIGVAGVAQPLIQFCETIRASVSDDDLDWINPWSPIDGSFFLPNVKSWSELTSSRLIRSVTLSFHGRRIEDGVTSLYAVAVAAA